MAEGRIRISFMVLGGCPGCCGFGHQGILGVPIEREVHWDERPISVRNLDAHGADG